MKNFILIGFALLSAPALADSPEVGGEGTAGSPSVVCSSYDQKTYYYVFGGSLQIVDWSQGRPRTVAWVSGSGDGSNYVAQDRWYGPFYITGGKIRDAQRELGTCRAANPTPPSDGTP